MMIKNYQIPQQNHVKILKENLKSLEQSIQNPFSDMSEIKFDKIMKTLL